MSYINTLTKFAAHYVGRPFSERNHFSENGVKKANHACLVAESELPAENLPLPSKAAVKSQTLLPSSLIEKIRLLLSVKKSGPQSDRYFPPEILLMIVPFLRTEDIKMLRCVSREWNQIATPFIRRIEVANAAELPGALNFLLQTGPDTTTLRLAKGGWARNIPKIRTYPSLTDKNIKIALDKAELAINKKNEKIILQEQQALCLTKNVSLPIEKLQLYQVDLKQAEFISPSEITVGSNAFSSKWEKTKSLELKECQLSTTALIKILKAMPNLRGIGLYACTGLSDLGMASLNTGFLGSALLKVTALSVNRLLLNQLVLENLAFSEKLEEIRLVGGHVSAHFLRLMLKNKPNLKYFEMSSCQLINDDDFSFLDNRNLVSLKLFNCQLSDNFLHALLKNSPNLKDLEVVGCIGLTPSVFSNVASLKLNSLRLVRCQLSDVVFNGMIKNQHELSSLEVRSCIGLTHSAFLALSKLKLFSLTLSRCELSDAVLYLILINQPDLRVLEIDLDTGLTDLSISFLKSLKLNYLRLNGGEFSESAARGMTQVISGLEELYLNRCDGLNTKIFLDAKPLEKLKVFNMDVCFVPGMSFEAIMQAMPALEEVYFRRITFLMDKSFSNEFKLEKVEILTLENSRLSNQYFKKIIDIMPNVKELRLNKSSGLTDKALLEVRRLRKLEVLDVSGCKFSKKALNVIKEHVGKVINHS